MITKFDDPGIIANLVETGDIKPSTIRIIQYEGLCETFGWTIKELIETDIFWIDSFTAILRGRQKAISEKTNPKK